MSKTNKTTVLYSKLDEIYYNPSEKGSYGGVQRLFQNAKENGLKVTLKTIKNYLRDQASYTLHKPARKRFSRNPTVVGGIDYQWQADLADMQALARDNQGAHYILTVIDVFSKFAWAVPVQNKGAKEILKAFQEILKLADPRKPKKLQTDKGKEFLNKDVQDYLKSQGIHHFCSNSDQKAAVVERFNRTLKTRIWTYFTAKQTYKYLEILPKFLESYNHSFHRSIGMKPVDVRKKDEDKIWNRLYGKFCGSQKQKCKVGDKVRVSKVKGVFEKGYLPSWSQEHFHVEKVIRKAKPVYKIKDDLGEGIKGEFYEEELQPILENRYLVEKILRKRKLQNGKFEFFVKWKGWPTKFNSWVSEADIEQLK